MCLCFPDAVKGAGPAGIVTADMLATLTQEKGISFNSTIYEQSHAIGEHLVLNSKNFSDLIFPFDSYGARLRYLVSIMASTIIP